MELIPPCPKCGSALPFGGHRCIPRLSKKELAEKALSIILPIIEKRTHQSQRRKREVRIKVWEKDLIKLFKGEL